jgi:ABC-type proline/glycine betaine transport system substrate-binding protein
MFRGVKLVIVLVFFAALVAACGGGAQETITLVENPWPASELNVAVAKIIIENELGNPVEIVALDENAQWDAISGGDVDASLEVWPSGHTERIAEYIDDLGTVENGGLLGPVGEIGWFVPTYVIDNNPALATWEGYQDAAAEFASAETGDLGRFLGADPSWVQYDEQIIENLGLPFQVVWTGSEDALLAEVCFTSTHPTLSSSSMTCPRLNCRPIVTNVMRIRPRLIAPIRRTSCLKYSMPTCKRRTRTSTPFCPT